MPQKSIDGEFWMMNQLQNEPERGDTIEWGEIPKDMLNELYRDWRFMGVLPPRIGYYLLQHEGLTTVCLQYF